jgi:DNA polymerase-1
VKVAEKQGFTSYMVTPDKDFGQLVSGKTFVYKPSRMGDGIEIMGVKEILDRWGIQRTDQVVDILGLMGDASDNIPGVPGIGEKTASKLIGQFGSIENLLARTGELKGKIKETLETHREAALLSKRLATIHRDSPAPIEIEALRLRDRNDEAVRALCVEYEFSTIGKRLFGSDFKAGRGFTGAARTPAKEEAELDFTERTAPAPAELQSLKDVPHDYQTVSSPEARADLITRLRCNRSAGE